MYGVCVAAIWPKRLYALILSKLFWGAHLVMKALRVNARQTRVKALLPCHRQTARRQSWFSISEKIPICCAIRAPGTGLMQILYIQNPPLCCGCHHFKTKKMGLAVKDGRACRRTTSGTLCPVPIVPFARMQATFTASCGRCA